MSDKLKIITAAVLMVLGVLMIPVYSLANNIYKDVIIGNITENSESYKNISDKIKATEAQKKTNIQKIEYEYNGYIEEWKREMKALNDKNNEYRSILCSDGEEKYCPKEEASTLGASFKVRVTSYNPQVGQTDHAPCIGAVGHDVCHFKEQEGLNVIALSQDLVSSTWDSPFKYGDVIVMENENPVCNGEFIVLDTMNARFRNRADLFFMNREQNTSCYGAIIRKIDKKYDVPGL